MKYISLKKDILLYYEYLLGEEGLVNGLNYPEIMANSYWLYTDIDGEIEENGIEESDIRDIQIGCLIILIGFMIEATDLECDREYVFKGLSINDFEDGVAKFIPASEEETRLKLVAELAIEVFLNANSEEGEYSHPKQELLYEESCWVNNYFVKNYFRSRLGENT